MLCQVHGRWRFYKAKREFCAIWISARYDNSGSSDLKCACFVGLWQALLLFCLYFYYFCVTEAILRVGKWDGEMGNCVITWFLRNCIILFSTIDWCQCPLLRRTFPPVTVKLSDFSFLLDVFQVSLDLRESKMWSWIPAQDEDGLINDNLCWNTSFDSFILSVRICRNPTDRKCCQCLYKKGNETKMEDIKYGSKNDLINSSDRIFQVLICKDKYFPPVY